MPWRITASSVYPDKNKTLVPGCVRAVRSATSRPPQPRHDYVGHQQVNPIRMLPGHAQGLHAIPGFQHVITTLFQDVPAQRTHVVLVFHEQHRLDRAAAS